MRIYDPPSAKADRPDRIHFDPFGLLKIASLSFTGLLSLVILSGWRSAPISQELPDGWWLMQASTALSILVLTLALLLPRRSSYLGLLRKTSGMLAVSLAALGQPEIWGAPPPEYYSFLVDDNLLPLVQPMSAQSAFCFFLLGAVLLIEPNRPGWPGLLVDAALMVLVIFNLVFISAYLFDAGLLVGPTEKVYISPHALACITLMTIVLAGERAPFGFLAVLVGEGLGSRMARRLLPLAVAMSFLIILGGERLQGSGLLSLPNAEAVTAAFTAVLMITVVILLARRINHLERGLRDMSLTDELTGLHNLRGFHERGTRALREACLQDHPAMLLFFDVDGLKKVNDTLGHDVGSQLLREFADLLKETFRGSDIVGRVGGDEFAIITTGRHRDTSAALQRLAEATVAANSRGRRPYLLNFSVGQETVDASHSLTLRELMANADAAMYRHKRRKRSSRGATQPAPGYPPTIVADQATLQAEAISPP